MTDLSNLKLKVQNYKCFSGGEPQGFNDIRPINLIIGKNNSGKSSLLEVVENATEYNNSIVPLSPNDAPPKIIVSKSLTDEDVQTTFTRTHHSPDIPGGDDYQDFGRHLVSQTIVYSEGPQGTFDCLDIGVPETFRHTIPENHRNRLTKQTTHEFSGKIFKRLFAERDIKPEGDNPTNLAITENGGGITNLINNIINSETLPSELAEEKFLKELNKIMMPDAEFSRILVQKRGSSHWEVELQEKGRTPVSLTHSGSGL